MALDGRNRLEALSELGQIAWRSIAEGGKPDRKYFQVLNIADDAELGGYIRSLNDHRRHLNREQKRAWAARELTANPDQSNRRIAETVGIDHETVGAVRDDLERRGGLRRVETRIDTKGRKQPAHRRTPSLEPLWHGATDAERAALVRHWWEHASESDARAFLDWVSPFELAEFFGMAAFYKALSPGQKKVIVAEQAREREERERARRASTVAELRAPM
jgi:DNA-binding Lrp family transcriptional regulator